jgi:hypothetical protein
VLPEPKSTAKVPVESKVAVFVVVALAVPFASKPVEAAIELMVAVEAALADGTATTESSPAPSADTATSAMRLRSVFVDMFFLSLVEIGNFPISARRSFDLLIPLLL